MFNRIVKTSKAVIATRFQVLITSYWDNPPCCNESLIVFHDIHFICIFCFTVGNNCIGYNRYFFVNHSIECNLTVIRCRYIINFNVKVFSIKITEIVLKGTKKQKPTKSTHKKKVQRRKVKNYLIISNLIKTVLPVLKCKHLGSIINRRSCLNSIQIKVRIAVETEVFNK